MTPEHMAVAIRDALNLLEHVETENGETSIDVVDDFSNLFITTGDGDKFFVKVTRLD